MHVQLLFTQHFLAVAARFLPRCSRRRGSGHSMVPITVNFKPTLRCILFKFTHRGRNGPMPSQQMLVHKIRNDIRARSNEFSMMRRIPRSGHSTVSISAGFKPPFDAVSYNNRDARLGRSSSRGKQKQSRHPAHGFMKIHSDIIYGQAC
jgi:hypothetical protein